ncbi:hypothetical protein Tco_0274735, partial [Tanacetum coccineum]
LGHDPLGSRFSHGLRPRRIIPLAFKNHLVFKVARSVMRSLGWHLEEVHVTWTQFGKKRTRIQLYTKLDIKSAYRRWRRRRNSLRRRQKAKATASEIFKTAPEVTDLKEALEDSAGQRRRN